jgi:RNA-binding protein 5/10
LIRGVSPVTQPEDIRDRLGAEIVRLAQMDKAHTVQLSDGRSAIKRVVLIKDRHSKAPLGFGFVELASPELATGLLAHLISREAQPVGFVIDGRPIACSFANTSAFTAAGENGHLMPWVVGGSPDGGLGGVEGWVKYWDNHAGASELIVRPDHAGVRVDPLLLSYIECIKIPVTADASAGGAAEGKKSGASSSAAGGLTGGMKMQPLKIGLGGGGKKRQGELLVPLSLGIKSESSAGE